MIYRKCIDSNSDFTFNYEFFLSINITIEDFFNYIKEESKKHFEWGKIKIISPYINNPLLQVLDYGSGSISFLDEQYLFINKLHPIKVTAKGGWGNVDYLITLEET